MIEQVLPHLVVHILIRAEHLPDLFFRNGPVSVFVEHLKHLFEFLFVEHLFSVDGGRDELGVVDRAALVRVDFVKYTLNFFLANAQAEDLVISFLELIQREKPIAVEIEELEGLVQPLTLLLGGPVVHQERPGGLLELVAGPELLNVAQHVLHALALLLLLLLVDLFLVVHEPRVLQRLEGRVAELGVVGQHLADEGLALVGNLVSLLLREGELASLDRFHDILFVSAIVVKRRIPADHNVSHHPDASNIALVSVVLVEDLGGDVVGRPEPLLHFLVFVEDARGPEVDDFDRLVR